MDKPRRVTVEEVPPAKVTYEDGWKNMDIRFIISDETVGAKRMCVWRTIVAYGAAHEKHIHKNSEEMMYIIRGRGVEGIGDKEYDLRPGVAVFVPKGVVHWTRCTDPSEPLEYIGVYSDAANLEESGYVFVEHLEEENEESR